MAIGDKVAYKTVREIINYCKNILGINKDMQKYIQSIIKTFGEVMDEEGKNLFKKLEGALATVSTADQWLSDPQIKSEITILLQRLNKLPDDPKARDMLKFTKEILQSVRDGLGRNDGEFMRNLSGALETVADFKGIVNVIREYLTPTNVTYFGIASPIAAKVLMHVISFYTKNDPSTLKDNEELNILNAQLIAQFEIGRMLAGLFLIARTSIKIKIQTLTASSTNNSLQLDNAEILDQIEQECKNYLEHIAPLSSDFLIVIQGIQLRIEEEMKANKKLVELTPAVLLDRINCFTHGEIVLQGLYENTFSVNLVSIKSFLTWKYFCSNYEQNKKLVIVLHKFTDEIKKSFSELFDIITKTQIYTQFCLWQALTVIYSDEECDYELHFPAISSELADAYQHYHQVLNEAHVRDLLRAEEYTGLNEDNALYDLLINLLRKRAFFEVSHQLLCSLRFPNNISREVKIGALDVYNTFRHPIDTIKNMAYASFLFACHPIQTPCQIGSFFWNRPMRVLTSTAITGAIAGGVGAISKMSTAASSSRTLAGFNTLSAEFGGKSVYAGVLTPETYAMIHGTSLEGVAAVSSAADSSLSIALVRTGAMTSATVANLPQSNFKKEVNLAEIENRRAQIATIFQDEDHRLLSMNAESFFKTIDQIILDNEDEIKDIMSYCKC